jgi:hypothetical protein
MNDVRDCSVNRNRKARIVTGPLPDLNHADLIVVFDNNAYGDLVAGKDSNLVGEAVAELVHAERQNLVQALANPLVLVELVALLDDPTKSAYRPAELAIMALAGHCRIETPTGPVIGSLADSTSLIAQALFGRRPPAHFENSQLLISLAAYIAQEKPAQMPEEAVHLIRQVKTHVDETEEQFVQETYRYTVQSVNPNATDWAPLRNDPQMQARALEFLGSPESAVRFGEMLLQHVLDALGITEVEPRRLELAREISESFQVPWRLMNEILRRILTQGCDLRKRNRRNWIWDMHIACSVGVQHSIEGKPLRLITTDGDILAASAAAGCGELVQSYADYRQALQSGSVSPVGV